jgi:hypothetical protein
MTCRRIVLAALLAVPALAVAHPPPRTDVREIVRLKGRRRADGDAPAGRMQLVALGSEQPFAATERDVYSLTADEAAKPADRYTLQGAAGCASAAGALRRRASRADDRHPRRASAGEHRSLRAEARSLSE